MNKDNQPINLVLRRQATLLTLSEVLSGETLLQAMWMIEDQGQLVDRLTFLDIVSVTAEFFSIENQVITSLNTKLNNNLLLPNNELPVDPLPEMLKFRDFKQTQTEKNSSNKTDYFQQPLLTGTSSSVFQARDILGMVGEYLTEEIILQIGQAMGSELKEHNCTSLIMAHDGHLSSIKLTQILTKGLLTTGINLIHLGAAPLPALNFITHHSVGKAGILIICEHDLIEYNGLKLIGTGKMFEEEKIQHIIKRIDREEFKSGEEGKSENNNSFIEEYIGMICEDIHINKSMKIVLDSGGIVSSLSKKLLESIGCEVIDIYEKDKPNTTKLSDVNKQSKLAFLISSVLKYQADIGFSFDDEGARLRVVDSKGIVIRPDKQMMLFSKHILATYPCSEIIHDNQDSSHLTKLIAKCNGHSLLCKTGSGFMRKKLITSGAKFAGDMHGHIYFYDRWFGFDDALYAACRMLEILSIDGLTSSEVFAELPESLYQAEITFELTENETRSVFKTLIRKLSNPDEIMTNIDGLRVDFFDGWALIRADERASSLFFHFEAKNEDALDKIKNQLKLWLLQVEPNLRISF